MKKKYLVTGGTGFLGAALVKRLVKEGCAVRVLDNDTRGSVNSLKEVMNKIEFFKADIRDAESVNNACEGVDSVIHLAFINGTQFFYEKPELVLEVGVKGMMNVIDGCIKNNVKELILASSSEVYQVPEKTPTDEKVRLIVPDPLNPRYSYGGGKIISELITINYGRKYFDRVMIFRPHNVYGPSMGWEHVIPQFVLRMKEIVDKTKDKKIKFPIQGTGRETRSFVFIEDFIDGLMVMLEKGKHMEIYNIGNDKEITISELAKEIGDYFNRKVEIVKGELTKGSTPRRCPDITKIKSLGFMPKTSLKEGLKITARWYAGNSDESRKNYLK